MEKANDPEVWALFDREHRALHDHIAGTYLIIDNE